MAASGASIYGLALQSEQDLEKLQMLFASKNDDRSRLIQRQRERFQHWAGHLGVFAVPQASLDHRLENAPQTRDLILQLLRTLEKNIQHAFKSGFTTGDENPQPDKSVLYQYKSTSPSKEQKNNPEYSKSDTPASGEVEEKDSSPKVIDPATQAALEGIRRAINWLHHLGLAIRETSKSTIRSRVKRFTDKHAERTALLEHFTLLVVRRLYPRITDSFASQLAESVSFRRQRLEHQVRHEKILNQRRDPEQDMQEQTEELSKVGSEPELETLQPVSNPNQSQRIVQDHGLASEKKEPSKFPQAGPSSVTEPSEFKEPRQEQLLEYIGLTRKQSGPRTETSMNPNMLYPPTPKIADTEAYYKCTWCSKQIPVPEDMTKWRLDWRAHFNEDLEPYVCISEECSAQPVYFSSRRNWQAHMNESRTVDWSQEIHKNAIWYCDLDPHGYQEFMDAEELRHHLKSKHEGTVTSEESETLVAMNTMYVSRSPTECPLCSEDILNLVENEPIPAKPAANREFPDLLNNSAETKPGYQASHDHLDSDEEGDETYLVATAPQTSEEHGSELSNRMKMMIHVGRHLKSLSFMSLRYFEDSDEEDDEKGSAKSYKVALGARAERSSQEQHGDHYFELEDSLTFEDVSPDQRFLSEEEDEVHIGKSEDFRR
ncbi:hypothetical protein BHE90_004068 [Fusarium euwallaceae]|uniref:Uncharacterized protein n=1 Tax=Fusarium euwallaceae TaxID=1147111 RepID=A0A430M0D7_9HYPO|nr:hypothetical protein BHE90_004068 [Fusarium euwallaceae]